MSRINGLVLTACLLAVSIASSPRAQGAPSIVAPANARNVPGVVILDPDAALPSSPGRAIAHQLARAGYATWITRGDPLGAAAVLRRHAMVEADNIAVVGYGEAASAILAAIVERYDLDVAHPPVFRSAVAYAPDCSRAYGDWTGRSLASAAGGGSTGAPHAHDVATAGLYRTPTPLLIVGGGPQCEALAHDSFLHEYFVTHASNAAIPTVEEFIANYAVYSIVSFPSSQIGVTLRGELVTPRAGSTFPAVIISPGTAGIEGFSFWERPWARRLQQMGYASLIVDSYMARHSAWKDHWRIDARTMRARDLLDAQAYLGLQPFVRAGSIGLLGRSSGGTAILAAIVADTDPPATPPPFPLDARPPFSFAVADYGYCQLSYGAWPGGTPAPSVSAAYRTQVPLLLQVGQLDTTVSAPACEALAASATAAGVPLELHVYPGAAHRFDAGAAGVPASTVSASVARISSFIRAHSAL